mgnify:CR=1 FL=1
MQITHTQEIQASVPKVFKIMRDDLATITSNLPNINSIEQISRKTKGDGTVNIINHWQAKTKIPILLESIIDPSMFAWADDATWFEKKKYVAYDLKPLSGLELFSAKGNNAFKPTKNGFTELQMNCELKINVGKIPGVPRFLASRISPAIEKLIHSVVEPNIIQLSLVFKDYIEDKG